MPVGECKYYPADGVENYLPFTYLKAINIIVLSDYYVFDFFA